MEIVNYFTFFALPQTFAIDKNELHEKYLANIASAHPDKIASLDQQKNATSFTAAINNGYKILLDDLLRAEYLLQLQNIDLSKDDSSYKASTKLLIIITELREYLEELNDKEQLRIFEKEQNIAKQKILDELTILYQSNNLDQIIEKIYELKYLTKLLTEIKSKKKALLNYSN